MTQIGSSGIFTYFSEDAKLGMYYKYLVFDQYGNCVEKLIHMHFIWNLDLKMHLELWT